MTTFSVTFVAKVVKSDSRDIFWDTGVLLLFAMNVSINCQAICEC